MKKQKFAHRPTVIKQSTPFSNAEEAWFWTVNCAQNMYEGAKIAADNGRVSRPCDPRDVLIQITHLKRKGILKSENLQVLSEYGSRQAPPDDRIPEQREKHEIWQHTMAVLGPPLFDKGIIQSL